MKSVKCNYNREGYAEKLMANEFYFYETKKRINDEKHSFQWFGFRKGNNAKLCCVYFYF